MAADFMGQRAQFLNSSLLIGIALMACQHPISVVGSDDLALVYRNGIVYFNQSTYSGDVLTLFPGTTFTATIQRYKEGKEHGPCVQYYPSGKIKEKRNFYDGTKTGDMIAWWENGEKMLQYSFKNDEYEGTCREWNSCGQLIQEMNYHQGYELGSQKVWYDDGKIKTNYTMMGGRRYGLLGTKNCVNVSDSIF